MKDVSSVSVTDPAVIFVHKLEELSDSDLRLLRQASGKRRGQDVRVYDLFCDLFRPLRRKHMVTRWAYYLAATLYPWHPENSASGNLGAACRHLRPLAREQLERERADRRFIRLLDAKGRDLGAQLLSTVRTLQTADVAINWPQLINDLSEWYSGDHKTQHNWAKSYFIF